MGELQGAGADLLFPGAPAHPVLRSQQPEGPVLPEVGRHILPQLGPGVCRPPAERVSAGTKKKISQLSKGQMSMVTILIALASRAPITILDEPAAGLDVVMREQFYQLLLEDFAQTGRTFLVSTHIIEEAASVFEQVIILDQGRILENSPTEELVEQFRYISGREDVVDQACAGLEVLSVQQMGRHKTAAVRGSDAQFRQARQADVDVSPMNLQNVFVALCGHGDAQ